MKVEEEKRLRDNPRPTAEELYMAAFAEWLEPQVRDAVREMYRKGYATQSSGFHGEDSAVQMIDGYFSVDEKTKRVLEQMGVEVLRGADVGLPKNKILTVLRFRASNPSVAQMKERWDAVAAALPKKILRPGVLPICDRAEEFRKQYAPEHPSLDKAREEYFEYLRRAEGLT